MRDVTGRRHSSQLDGEGGLRARERATSNERVAVPPQDRLVGRNAPS
jgi:hypothetical protein